MSELSLRVMGKDDVPAVEELRRLAEWNQTPEDWRRLLELEPEGCFLAELESELAGTVTTTAYGQAIAWLGMMLVHPKHRRQGIATRLMGQAIEYLRGRGVRCIRLDATPAGYPVYERLGFVPEWTLTRGQRPAQDERQASNSGCWCSDDAGVGRAGLGWHRTNRWNGVWDAAPGPAAELGAPQRQGVGLACRAACRGLGPAPRRSQRGLPGSSNLSSRRRSNRAGHGLVGRDRGSARVMGRSGRERGGQGGSPTTRLCPGPVSDSNALGPYAPGNSPLAQFAIANPAVG